MTLRHSVVAHALAFYVLFLSLVLAVNEFPPATNNVINEQTRKMNEAQRAQFRDAALAGSKIAGNIHWLLVKHKAPLCNFVPVSLKVDKTEHVSVNIRSQDENTICNLDIVVTLSISRNGRKAIGISGFAMSQFKKYVLSTSDGMLFKQKLRQASITLTEDNRDGFNTDGKPHYIPDRERNNCAEYQAAAGINEAAQAAGHADGPGVSFTFTIGKRSTTIQPMARCENCHGLGIEMGKTVTDAWKGKTTNVLLGRILPFTADINYFFKLKQKVIRNVAHVMRADACPRRRRAKPCHAKGCLANEQYQGR